MQKSQKPVYKSVRSIITEQAKTYGSKPYMVSIDQEEKELSYENLFRLGNQIAAFLAARGLKANDRILMLSENSIEFISVFLGVQRAGGTIATANVEICYLHLHRLHFH